MLMTTSNGTPVELTIRSNGARYVARLSVESLDSFDVEILRVDGEAVSVALGMFDAGGLDCGDANATLGDALFEKISDRIEEWLANARRA
jgi:hypothetical protein